MLRVSAFLEELARLGTRTFTFNEACRVLGKERSHCKTYLHRAVASGAIVRVEKGKYCVKDADPFEIASNLVYPSYVSFLSALDYHGLTTQLPVAMQVACCKQKAAVQVAGYEVSFITMGRKRMFGFERHENAFIASPEKAVIDGLYLPRHLPVDEAREAISVGLSADLLVDHAIRFQSPVVAKRLGHLLEHAGIDKHAALKHVINTKYDKLDPLSPVGSLKDAKWYLLLPGVMG